jgi:TonB-linked SusC/RagA family outer membrane protein
MMQTKLILCIFLLSLISLQGFAQSFPVSGTVTNAEDNLPLPGVTVLVKGTSHGAITDADGHYSIDVSSGDVLKFSFVGMTDKEVQIGRQRTYNVVLEPQSFVLDEYVVTALGIKREKKALGYSVQKISGRELEIGKDASMINQLAGKVAGLNVSATNAGAGSSSRIVLRGVNSFMGDNNALIVVDGVPIENQTYSNAEDTWGGRDYGSGVSDINSDDIESISVLKGASASALYGSRAANGVILIVTKKGSDKNKLGVSFTTDAALVQPYILYNLQNTYGAGRNGKFTPTYILNDDGIPVYNTTGASAFGSWGPRMNGQQVIGWDGNETTYSPQPDNYSNFFQNGLVVTNSLSLDGSIKNTNLRLSVADMRKKEIIENSTFERTNIGLNINSRILKGLSVSSYISYLHQQVDNRFGLADSKENPNRNYIMMPRNISNASLENNMMNAENKEQAWFMNWAWQGNPFYATEHQYNGDVRDRIFGNIALNYTPNDQLTFQIRSAPDYSLTQYEQYSPVGSITASQGEYSEREIEQFLINTDVLATYNRPLTETIDVTLTAGANAMVQQTRFYDAYTIGGLTQPGVYNISNSFNTPYSHQTPYYKKAVNSLYALGQIGYNDFLYLDITGRNDWSSTLPENRNSFFYPSVSLGFVYSELLTMSDFLEKALSFGKLRLSYAQVGNDTDPYQLNATYFIDSVTNPYGTIAHISNQVPPAKLKPEIIHSFEIGSEFIFFMNRASLDVTWYNNRAVNQILPADISHASGSTTALINAGEIQNSGIEIQLGVTPIKTDDFSWNVNINYNKNRSEVVELTPGLDNLQILEHWNMSIEARPGRPYGDIVGYAMQRDEHGNKLVDQNGMYLRSETPQVLGNINPDFSMSFSNSLRYKSVSLSFLIDARFGGEMFAGTNMYGYGYSGNFDETLAGREAWYASEEAREEAGLTPAEWIATGGYLASGVYAEGTIIDGVDVSGLPNTTYVNPELYWDQFSNWTNEIHEPFVYDASFVKLRQLSIGYTLPQKFTNKLRLNQCTVSAYGRNLWVIHKNVPNIDPETMHTNGNGQGYELYSYPNQRSFGVSLNIKI